MHSYSQNGLGHPNCMEMVCEKPLPIDAAREGDPVAWETLFKRFQLPLFAYLMEIIGQKETCFDLVQETFLAATQHLNSLRRDDRFASWLFSIAHQKAIQWLRRHAKYPEQPRTDPEGLDEPAPEAENPAQLLIQREAEAAFYTALARLPLPQKEAILLHWLEDFGIEEIARITGTPPGTVKSRLFHARKHLKSLMKQLP